MPYTCMYVVGAEGMVGSFIVLTLLPFVYVDFDQVVLIARDFWVHFAKDSVMFHIKEAICCLVSSQVALTIGPKAMLIRKDHCFIRKIS